MKKKVKSLWGEAFASGSSSSLSISSYRATLVDDVKVHQHISLS
jgi:hypothetical protein